MVCKAPSVPAACAAAALAACTAITPLAVTAQTVGSVRGFVYDAAGERVPHARIIIRNRYETIETATDKRGFFVTFEVEPGRYTIEADSDAGSGSLLSCMRAGQNMNEVVYVGHSATPVTPRSSNLNAPDPSQTSDLYSVGDC